MPISSDPSPAFADPFDNEALLLVESLLLELIGAGALTVDRAIAVVEIALEARDQVRDTRGAGTSYDGGALDAILATLHREQPAIG